MGKTLHHWQCSKCGHLIMFKQPEIPGDDPRSEMNEDKTCPKCGGEMYFDEAGFGVQGGGEATTQEAVT